MIGRVYLALGLAVVLLTASAIFGASARDNRHDLLCKRFIADMTGHDQAAIVRDTTAVEAMFGQSARLLDGYLGIDLVLDHAIPRVSDRQAMIGRACEAIPHDPVWRVVRLTLARSVVTAMTSP